MDQESLSSASGGDPPGTPQASHEALHSLIDGGDVADSYWEGSRLSTGTGGGTKRTPQITEDSDDSQARSKKPRTGELSSKISSTRTTSYQRAKSRKRKTTLIATAHGGSLSPSVPLQPWTRIRHGSSRLENLPAELLEIIKDHLHASATPKALRMPIDDQQGNDYDEAIQAQIGLMSQGILAHRMKDALLSLSHTSTYCRNLFVSRLWSTFRVDFGDDKQRSNAQAMLPTVNQDATVLVLTTTTAWAAQRAFRDFISEFSPSDQTTPICIDFTEASVLEDWSWDLLTQARQRLPQLSRVTLPGCAYRTHARDDRDDDDMTKFAGSMIVRRPDCGELELRFHNYTPIYRLMDPWVDCIKKITFQNSDSCHSLMVLLESLGCVSQNSAFIEELHFDNCGRAWAEAEIFHVVDPSRVHTVRLHESRLERRLEDPNDLGALQDVRKFEWKAVTEWDVGWPGKSLVKFILANSHLEEVVIEYPKEAWEGDLAGALYKLSELKKLYVRAGEDDECPWDLSTLVKACPLMEFYGVRINEFALQVGQGSEHWNAQFVTFLQDFGRKITEWKNLKELKISLPSTRTYEHEYLWAVNDLYRILTLEYTANLTLQTIRLEPHKGRPTAGRRNTKPNELLFYLNKTLGVFERVLE